MPCLTKPGAKAGNLMLMQCSKQSDKLAAVTFLINMLAQSNAKPVSSWYSSASWSNSRRVSGSASRTSSWRYLPYANCVFQVYFSSVTFHFPSCNFCISLILQSTSLVKYGERARIVSQPKYMGSEKSLVRTSMSQHVDSLKRALYPVVSGCMHTIREFTTTKDCFNGKKPSIGLLCPNNSPAAPEMYKMPSSFTRTDTSESGSEMMSTTRALTAGSKVIADTTWLERKLRPNWHFCPDPQPNTLPEEPKSKVWRFPQHAFLICSGQLIHNGLFLLFPSECPNCKLPFCPNACTDSCSQMTMEWYAPQATKVANRAEPASICKGTCCQLSDAVWLPNPSCP